MLTPVRLGTLFVIAAGTPYVASETEFGRSTVRAVTNMVRTEDTLTGANAWTRDGDEYANHSHYEVEELRRESPDRFRYEEKLVRKLGGLPEGSEGTPQLTGIQIDDLRACIRFDVDPDWVVNRFSRVSTVLSEMTLRGLRVPFVTGTKAEDIAGTLTYYFDRGGKLQRLTIHGFTGDTTKLVTAATRDYGMQPEPSLEAGVYTRRWNGLPIHFLRLTHAPVIYSNAVHNKYTVFLELNHPNLAYGISNEARQIVNADHATGRW